jgi:hypothetical protein
MCWHPVQGDTENLRDRRPSWRPRIVNMSTPPGIIENHRATWANSRTNYRDAQVPPVAAEDVLEVIMRRHERASAFLTSIRPVEDRGKLLGELHRRKRNARSLSPPLACEQVCPRSWRTKLDAPAR